MKSDSKNWRIAGLFALALIIGTVSTATAEDKPEADLTVGLYSQYLWRGWAYSKDSVVVQPSMTVAYKGFGFNLWGNLDSNLTSTEVNNWTETDMTVSCTGSKDKIGYSLGYIYYGLDGLPDSQEIYAGLSLDVLLSPSLTIYKEISGVKGWYASLGISHSLPIKEGLDLDLGATVGYYDNDAGYNEFHNGLLSATMTFPLNQYVSISPGLYYSLALSDAANDKLKADNLGVIGKNESNFIYGGLSVKFVF